LGDNNLVAFCGKAKRNHSIKSWLPMFVWSDTKHISIGIPNNNCRVVKDNAVLNFSWKKRDANTFGCPRKRILDSKIGI
jgi:hypothetical protein